MNRKLKGEKRAKKPTDPNLEDLEAVNVGEELLDIGRCVDCHRKRCEKKFDAEGREIIEIGASWSVFLSKRTQQKILGLSFIGELVLN